ncbi:MAG: hypothetical protein VKM34_08350, partial [Cyanobacteriota bacterium]|nr:hypothetical protein [Cyanobacteriota bacterium]
MLIYKRTSDILQASGLSLDRTYYLLCGSFGDRYWIASMLHHLLEADPAAVILVKEADREIARIFLGPELSRCLFVAEATYGSLVQLCRDDPNSYMPGKRQGLDATRDIPKGCIRSLHIVDYPYFAALNTKRLVRYIDLLRLMMGVPAATQIRMPPFLEERDGEAAEEVLAAAGLTGPKNAIINLVTFTHRNLPLEIYGQLEAELLCHGFALAYNVAQNNKPEIQEYLQPPSGRTAMTIPAHLMKPVYDGVDLVIGVIGGAMSIADSYSRCHCFTLHTPA